MTAGEALTRWTVRVALALYVATLAGGLLARPSPRREPGLRLLWTAGCLAFLAHVACAFHFHHGWSHADAYRETARRTAALFGLDWGGGLYLNYLFTLAWAADVLWWWLDPESRAARPRRLAWGLHGFLLFMAFNAAVVFEAGPVRWLGLAACLALAALWLRQRW